MSSRIDIVINESGSDVVTRAIESVADAVAELSPKTAMSLRGQALRVGVNTDRMVKMVAVAVLDTVVHRTPHDTGRARRAWQVNVSSTPPDATYNWEDKDYGGDRTVADGTSKVLGTKRAPGQSIYISNTLPYIQALNEGWSKQAPEMFVETAVQAGVMVAVDTNLVK